MGAGAQKVQQQALEDEAESKGFGPREKEALAQQLVQARMELQDL